LNLLLDTFQMAVDNPFTRDQSKIALHRRSHAK
jgi:hypothetical protein